jgi:hypothetical protein
MIIQTNKQLRPREAHDYYPTPLPFALAALSRITYKPTCILDIGAGSGVWGEAARQLWTGITVTGIEVRDVPRPKWYDFWVQGDLKTLKPTPAFDLVMSNPPYKYAEQAVRLSLNMLEDDCDSVHLLRLAFLEGQARGAGLYKQLPPYRVDVCSARPSFTGDGNTDATAYANFYWRKGWKTETLLGWSQPAQIATQLELVVA